MCIKVFFLLLKLTLYRLTFRPLRMPRARKQHYRTITLIIHTAKILEDVVREIFFAKWALNFTLFQAYLFRFLVFIYADCVSGLSGTLNYAFSARCETLSSWKGYVFKTLINIQEIRIEVFYEIVDFFMLDVCSKPIFCSNIAQKGKNVLEVAWTEQLLQTSKVAEHNRGRPNRS